MFPGMQNSVVVCRYQGPGNYLGQYLDQVGPLTSSSSCSSTKAAAEKKRGASLSKLMALASKAAADHIEMKVALARVKKAAGSAGKALVAAPM